MPTLRLARLATTAVCALALAPAAADAAPVTVGMTTFVSNPAPPIATGQNIPVFQGAAAGNYVLKAPVGGTITSWSFLSGGVAPGKTFALRVLRPVGATTFTAVATSGPAAVTSPEGADITQGPFLTSLPIAAGDRIALQPVNDAQLPNEIGANGADGIRYFATAYADATTAPLAPDAAMNNGQIVPVQATIQPAPPPGQPAPPAVPVAPQSQAPPLITGTPAAGQTLTCDPGGWGGTTPIAFTQTWTQTTIQRRARPHFKVTTFKVTKEIGNGPELTVPDLAPDTSTIGCSVTATNAAGPATAQAAAVTIVATTPEIAHRFTGRRFVALTPQITIPPQTGATATCSPGTWQRFPTRYAIVWFAGHNVKGHPTAGKRLVSRRATYRLRAIDAKRWLACRVVAYNAAGHGIAFSASVHGHA